MDSGYKLKWLNGLLGGRELLLPAGEIRIGGDDADVALSLEGGGQAVLAVDEVGVSLNTEVPVWIDGDRWSGAGQLPLNVPIDVAGQAFVLGAQTDAIVTVAVPERRRSASPVAKMRRRMYQLAAVTAAALAGAAALSALKPAPQAQVSQPMPSIVEQLRKRAAAGLKVDEDRSGVIVVSGYCNTAHEIDVLRSQAQQAGRLVSDESVCLDALRHSVRATLRANGYDDVDVANGASPGSVTLRGAFKADAKWRAAAVQLAAIRGLREWTVENDRARSFDTLLRMLADRNLLDGLSLSVEDRTLVAAGSLPVDRRLAIENVIAAYNHGGTGLPARFEDIAASTNTAGLLPSAIATVGGNANGRFVELENGMRLRPGAVLPSGFTVYAVSRSFVALRKAEQLYSVPFDS